MSIFGKKEQRQPEQIGLQIQTERGGLGGKLDQKLHRLETQLEVMPFWKNFSSVFFAISSIIIPAGILGVMLTNFSKIPMQIPLFYNPKISSWMLVDKNLAVFIPIIYGISNLVLININYSIFQFDRRLSQVIIFTMNIANILFMVAFSQILTIILI